MRHAAQWVPSKYSVADGTATASRDRAELAASSRLFASLIADFYNQVVPDFATGSLLDLGCGKQPLYGLYAPHVSRTTAVDWPSSLHTTDHLDLYGDLSRPLPLRDGSFDTVLSSDVLEHLPDPSVMFNEISRVLRPGGVLLLNTPFLYPVHEAPHDYLRHTRFSLAGLSEAAGLEVVSLVPIGGALEVLADTLGKLLGAIPWVGPSLAALVQGLAVRARHTSPIRRARALTAGHFPLGHGLVARKPG